MQKYHRYFPEPDLAAIKLSKEYIDSIKTISRKCQKAEKKSIKELGLSEDAKALVL